MADIVTSRQFATGEKNITAQKLNDIIGSSVIQPAFVSAKPVASAVAPADNLLLLTAGGAYNQVPFSVLSSSITGSANPNPAIWSVRLRSFNGIGNPNFEVDQRNVMGGVGNPASGTFIEDRWSVTKTTPTLAGNWNPTTNGVAVPGTNFYITRTILHFGLLTQQATLAAGDVYGLIQTVEGPQWRELMGDVTSISLLVRSSVAGLVFAVSLRDAGTTTKSLVKLCTIPAANTWTLIQLPNLPLPSGGNFNYMPGTAGYLFGIFLAAGTNFIAPAADTWQNGNFIGAPGMSNIGAAPVNSTFDIAMVQHEPGSVCSTFMDKPFIENHDECLRYYQKSYNYGVKPGAVNSSGRVIIIALPNQHVYGWVPFKKVMALPSPTVTGYDDTTGNINGVHDNTRGAVVGIGGSSTPGDSGFSGFTVSNANTAASIYSFHYTVDTSW
jgi:hypothetical protein